MVCLTLQRARSRILWSRTGSGVRNSGTVRGCAVLCDPGGDEPSGVLPHNCPTAQSTLFIEWTNTPHSHRSSEADSRANILNYNLD